MNNAKEKKEYPFYSLFCWFFLLIELIYSYLAIDNIIKKICERKSNKELWEIIDIFIFIFLVSEILLAKIFFHDKQYPIIIFFIYRIAILLAGQWHYIFKDQYKTYEPHILIKFLKKSSNKILSFIFDSDISNFKRKEKPFVRPAILGLINYFEVIVMFSYFHKFYSFSGNAIKTPQTFLDFLYFSVVTITTLGYGDYYPDTRFGRFLVIIEVIIGMLVILYFIATVISKGHKNE